MTMIMVTHDQEEALSIADRIVVMNVGAVEQVGSPAEIYDNPATRFVADFIGAMNFFSGTMAASDLVQGRRSEPRLPPERPRRGGESDRRHPAGGRPDAGARRNRARQSPSTRMSGRSSSSARTCGPASPTPTSGATRSSSSSRRHQIRRLDLAPGKRLAVQLPPERVRVFDQTPPMIAPTLRPRSPPAARVRPQSGRDDRLTLLFVALIGFYLIVSLALPLGFMLWKSTDVRSFDYAGFEVEVDTGAGFQSARQPGASGGKAGPRGRGRPGAPLTVADCGPTLPGRPVRGCCRQGRAGPLLGRGARRQPRSSRRAGRARRVGGGRRQGSAAPRPPGGDNHLAQQLCDLLPDAGAFPVDRQQPRRLADHHGDHRRPRLRFRLRAAPHLHAGQRPSSGRSR